MLRKICGYCFVFDFSSSFMVWQVAHAIDSILWWKKSKWIITKRWLCWKLFIVLWQIDGWVKDENRNLVYKSILEPNQCRIERTIYLTSTFKKLSTIYFDYRLHRFVIVHFQRIDSANVLLFIFHISLFHSQ